MVALTVQWLLRACVAGTFAGHGALAVIGQPKWMKYLRAAGFPDAAGAVLMPAIGLVDLAVAAGAVIGPVRPILFAWAAVWGFSTAMMRPLAGEGFLEFVERAGNWVPALALVLQSTAGHAVPAWADGLPAGSDAFHAHVTLMLVMVAGMAVFCGTLRALGCAGKAHAA